MSYTAAGMPEATFRIAYIVGLVVGSVIRVVYTKHYRGLRIADRRHSTLGVFLLALASVGMFILPMIYLFSAWLDFADYRLPAWSGLLGVALFALALWLLWKSHADLGLNWSPAIEIREEHALITGGVFRRIRHPMYAAHVIWGLAQPLLLQNWIAGWSMLATLLPLLVYRIPREEGMLLEHFGPAYRLYMHRTGRLIPRLW